MIPVQIQGIPALVRVTHYRPGQEPIVSGNPDSWEPGYPPEIEFDVLDEHGRPAPWLERLMRSEDTRVIEQEIIAAMTADARLAAAEWGAYA